MSICSLPRSKTVHPTCFKLCLWMFVPTVSPALRLRLFGWKILIFWLNIVFCYQFEGWAIQPENYISFISKCSLHAAAYISAKKTNIFHLSFQHILFNTLVSKMHIISIISEYTSRIVRAIELHNFQDKPSFIEHTLQKPSNTFILKK